tara:strand:- start:920 stop:1426 length:507 start_codon:yes stop_codon:yes gene_type:complete
VKDIISNCFLCGEHSLHVVGTEESQIMQCINCGYVTSTKFIGTKETSEEYKKLSDEMKSWSKEKNNRIWIPSIITLPIGMLYPFDDENSNMKWAFAPMIDISENEKENYPNSDGGFYTKRIDTDNQNIYNKFIDGMSFVNDKMKEYNEKKNRQMMKNEIKLPKLKKTK